MVREVSYLAKFTPLPEAPSDTIGVLQYRREAVPVVHLAKRLGERNPTLNLTDRLLFLEIDRSIICLVVHGVGKATIFASEKFSRDSVVRGSDTTIVEGVAVWGEELIALLDAEKLLRERKAVGEFASDDLEETASPNDFYSLYFPDITPACRQGLEERRWGLASEIVRRKSPEGERLTVFRLQEDYFGLPTTSIRELMELPRLTPVPCCPPHILGLASARDGIICVVDLREPLGLSTGVPPHFEQVIIVECEGLVFGIATGIVSNSLAVRESDIQPPPRQAKFLDGLITYGETSLGIINLRDLCRQGNLIVEVGIERISASSPYQS